MFLLGLTGLVNSIASFSLSLYTYSKNPRDKRHIFFLIGGANIGFYSFCYFLWQIADSPDNAFFWFKAFMSGVILLNAMFLHFIFIFFDKKNKNKEIFFHYLISSVFVFANINSILYSEVKIIGNIGYWPVLTNYVRLYLIFWSLQCLYGFYWLLRIFKTATGLKKEQMKYFIVAAIIGFFGSGFNWVIPFYSKIPPFSNISISIFVVVLAYIMIKHRFMDIKVNLSKAGIFIAVYAFVMGIPIYIGFKTEFGLISFIAMFFLATLGPITYQFLQKKAEDTILAQQKRYQTILREAAEGFVQEHDLDNLLKLVTKKIKEAMQISFAELFAYNTTKKIYVLRHQQSNFFKKDFSLSSDHPFIDYLKEKKEPVFFEEISHLFEKTGKNNPIVLIIPAFIDKDLPGFLVLGEKKDKSIYSEEDINTFKILSHQTSLAIQNSLAMEKNRLNQERIMQSEKLSFIGGMAEGVAHQIRNRLSYFSLAATEIDLDVKSFYEQNNNLTDDSLPLKKILSSLQRISNSLIDNVKRTDAIIKSILDYADLNQTGNELKLFSFKEALDGALDLVKIKHNLDSFKIKAPDEALVFGVKVQLLEILYNLIDNSCEALKEKEEYLKKESQSFVPLIEIDFTEDENFYLIKVKDNGLGIKEKEKDKIFAPYFTTKSSYKTSLESGVGLYTVNKMIREDHKGRIWCESKFLEGTIFYLELPKKNPE